MPLYVYKCPVHKEFEKLFSLKQRVETTKCIFFDEDFKDCDLPAEIQVSSPSMHPDKHWAGTVTPSGKTVFSRSEYEEDNKYLVPATEGNVSSVLRKKEQVKRESEEKHEKKVEHFLYSQLAGVTVEPDGNTVKEKNQFNKMRRS
jgi:hypothetical protein